MFCSVLVYGQFDKLQNYNVKDGLSSSDVYAVMQDSKGYMWFTGDMGVSRFNGYEFKNFSTSEGLVDNTVFGIYEDKKNRIWFTSYSNRICFYKNDTINVLPCNDTLEKMLRYLFVTSVYVDKGDTIWLGTTANFFIKINPGWHARDLKKTMLSNGKYFIKLEENVFLFGGHSPEIPILTGYDRNLHKIVIIDPGVRIDIKDKPHLRFFFIRLKDGNYLASIHKTLIKFNTKGILQKKEEKDVIINLLEDNKGSIFASTYDGAITYTNNELKNGKRIAELANKVITGMWLDKENGLWLNSEGQGIFYAPHRNFLYYTSQNNISESKIACIGTHESKVIVGHLDCSIDILYPDSVKTMVIPKKDSDNSMVARIVSVYDTDGRTIIITLKNVYYLENKKLTLIPELSASGLRKIYKSNDGNLWMLYYGQLRKRDPKKAFKIIDSLALDVRSENIFEDAGGVVWLSTIKGVYTYKNKVLRYLGNDNPLFTLRSSDIKEASDKSIWVATRGGGLLVKNGNKIKQFTEKQGLTGNMCRSLFVDSNIVWVGTNKGLSRITINGQDNYSIDNFYAKNGLLTNEVNTIIKFNKKLWLAHNGGISVFDVSNIKPNKYPPPIYILQTFVNDSLCKVEDLKELKYNKNRLTINYLGISYKDAGHIQYKYKMLGIDSNWVYTNYTTVSYHTIPPGTYHFVVSAKNNDSYWSVLPATVTIRILQPWWKNWIFILFVIIVTCLLIGFLFKHRLSTIKQKERLKAIQQTKLSNAELKALRAQMNPHFIFNAINSVQYFITNNDPVSSQKYLSKFAKLIRYVVDNSKPLAIPLSKELEALNLYLDLEWLRFENKFEYSIDLHENVDVEGVQIPSMLIQPYVENAIWHGLMHKNSKGKIKITISRYENVLFCVIEDNGIGRKRSQEIIKEKNNEFHKSVGLSITHERLEVINQQNDTKLTVNVIDLEDEEGNCIGTRVELNLPFY
ncbi:MAG: histidine kinase [Bacteroidetes bacterium]|nr:histidine kinase [Bacteroidota bacterium]